MKILITGGYGFIPSHLVRKFVLDGYDVTILDSMTYAANPHNLDDINGRFTFIKGDIRDKEMVERAIIGQDIIVNAAAQSHVDRSILDTGIFIDVDMVGAWRLLEAARKHDIKKFVQMSTDEVFGESKEPQLSNEESAFHPKSPYAASKAGADCLAQAFSYTYGIPLIMTRGCNTYGPNQFPEKVVPVTITKAIQNKTIPIYGDGMNVREWQFVQDHVGAIHYLVMHNATGIYNVGTGDRKTNLDLVREILRALQKPESLMKFVEDRLGHVRRHAIDSTKLRNLGWRPEVSFSDGIQRTVDWYKEQYDNNTEWLKYAMSQMG